jgi:DNA-directed RNA polymerase subunit RPC12/RpoP
MTRQPHEDQKDFMITCSWCGTKIREDKREDANGVCLKCFYRILSDRLNSQKRTVGGEAVSER